MTPFPLTSCLCHQLPGPSSCFLHSVLTILPVLSYNDHRNPSTRSTTPWHLPQKPRNFKPDITHHTFPHTTTTEQGSRAHTLPPLFALTRPSPGFDLWVDRPYLHLLLLRPPFHCPPRTLPVFYLLHHYLFASSSPWRLLLNRPDLTTDADCHLTTTSGLR
jgi:hypothetical protein